MSSGEGEALWKKDYVRRVLDTYVSLPGTPERPRRADRYLALELCRKGISLLEVETALLLGSARRIFRDDTYPLQPIRSLHYFVPVIVEVREEGIDKVKGYVQYLREKFEPLRRSKTAEPRKQRYKRVRGGKGRRDKARQLHFEW